MSAFGSFAGEESIDFRDLGDNLVFLINGPTGAGKTTLLDAICFALYGETTGSERTGKEMRSDFSEDDRSTEVTLLFQLANEYYKITRSPEQDRLKKLGEGTVSSKPKAILWKSNSGGDEIDLLVSTRVTEANKKIHELTGLNADQFRQVMVLPQGKFRELLMAKSAERETLFRQLFDTRIYHLIEQQLRSDAKELEEKVKDSQLVQETLLETVNFENQEQLANRLLEVAPLYAEAKDKKETQEKLEQKAAGVLSTGEMLFKRFEDLEKTNSKLKEFRAKEESMEKKKQEYTLSNEANGLLIFFEPYRHGESEYLSCKDAENKLRQNAEVAYTTLAEATESNTAQKANKKKLQTLQTTAEKLDDYKTRLTRIKLKANQIQASDEEEVIEAGLNTAAAGGAGLEEELKASLAEARQQRVKLERAWHQGQAALLASELSEKVPCPVCGSTEHPSIAKSDEEIPDAEVIETARQEENCAQESLNELQREIPANYRSLNSLNADIENNSDKYQTLAESIKAAQDAYELALSNQSEAKAKLQASIQQLEKAKSQRDESNSNWSAALERSSFENQNEFKNARQEPEIVEVLGHSIRKYEDERLKAQENHATLKKELQGKVKPDLESLSEAHRLAQDSSDAASESYDELDREQHKLKEVETKIKKAFCFQEKMEDRFKLVGTLSKIANGKNAYNMSLQRFVLSVILDDVLIMAAERLSEMSNGRFTLIRRTKITGAQRSGLELDVNDSYTGKTRPVSTLSGGESFMAALSMALGLSDVVQSHSGGIRLDALFVDEGFGSLDPESLDQAIDTLMDLQKSGRMVGVISHVPELKERIDVRIDVVAGNKGSRLEIGI